MILIALAAVFLLTIFLVRTKTVFNGSGNSNQKDLSSGLTYDNEILSDLVNRDTDGDGVLDWEEALWGTNPTKKDTNDDGIPDNVEIEKLKKEKEQTDPGSVLENKGELTQTDRFSQELFATVTALNQTGTMDQATIDKLSDSLATEIQNAPPRKVFKISDLTLTKDTSVKTVQAYNDTLNNIIDKKYPINVSINDVLQKFIVDDDNVDSSVLPQLDPIIAQRNKIIMAISKMTVPEPIANLHLEMLNTLERLVENISDIKKYDTDVIVSLSAITQFDQNSTELESVVGKLKSMIDQKLNS